MKRDKDKGLIDIACLIRHETDKAYLVDVGEKEPVWLPKSMVEMFDHNSGPIVTMPHWLAKEKGLI